MNTHRFQAGALALAAALACAGTAVAGPAGPGTSTGPSSTDAPYIVRSTPGVVSKSILTVGDSIGGYRMVGIPDGLGAYDNSDGTFTLLSNHELPGTAGTVRDHGAAGAFVSKWTIDKETLEVRSGEDLIQGVATWNAGASAFNAPGAAVLSRLCSADLPDHSAFFNAATGKGFDGRLFTSGEESGPEGRGFAHGLDGTSWELASLGNYSYENIVAHPGTGDRTVVASFDDVTGGQVYLYLGDKNATGGPVEKAGLTGGNLYGIKVAGFGSEPQQGIPAGTRFTLANLGDVSGKNGATLETESNTAGVTRWLRPEDGAWDRTDPNVLWFVTTNDFDKPSRLWKVRFDDITNPEAGGTVEAALDGTEGQQMLDNLAVSGRGDVVIQEDPGNRSYLARIWRYHPTTDRLVEVAHHRRDLFTTSSDAFMTQDEESSGIIDAAEILGDGWFLGDVQVHKNISATEPELVEPGQYFALHVPPGQKK